MTTIRESISLLASYKNGNTSVEIYSDGSKIREYEGEPKPNYPESIDIKITDSCSARCSFCHEQSTPEGKHGSTDFILKITRDLPAGVELAIGGGNPLSHPDLIHILEEFKARGIISNLTINQVHLKPYKELISRLIKDESVKGVGVSLTKKTFDIELLPKTPNLVFHVIAGIQDPSIIDELLKLPTKPKVLILGYKEYGFGAAFMNEEIKDKIIRWSRYLPRYFGKALLSFDNLAVKQLDVKRFFTDAGWSKFYMGDDGMFTMYIDAVLQTYAISSTKKRVAIGSRSIVECFREINTCL